MCALMSDCLVDLKTGLKTAPESYHVDGNDEHIIFILTFWKWVTKLSYNKKVWFGFFGVWLFLCYHENPRNEA